MPPQRPFTWILTPGLPYYVTGSLSSLMIWSQSHLAIIYYYKEPQMKSRSLCCESGFTTMKHICGSSTLRTMRYTAAYVIRVETGKKKPWGFLLISFYFVQNFINWCFWYPYLNKILILKNYSQSLCGCSSPANHRQAVHSVILSALL